MGRSGMLNNRIELHRKIVVKDEYGGLIESWALYKYLRAFIHRSSGVQTIDNDEVFDVIKLRVTLRNQSDIKEMDRLKINDKMYLIEFIQLDYTRRWLELQVTRINE